MCKHSIYTPKGRYLGLPYYLPPSLSLSRSTTEVCNKGNRKPGSSHRKFLIYRDGMDWFYISSEAVAPVMISTNSPVMTA